MYNPVNDYVVGKARHHEIEALVHNGHSSEKQSGNRKPIHLFAAIGSAFVIVSVLTQFLII